MQQIVSDSYFSDVRNLIRHFLASEKLATLVKDRKLSRFGNTFDQAEISRLLINISSYHRVKVDDGTWEHAEWMHEKYDGVGELVTDVEKHPEPIQLSLREACNKIIHSKKVEFDIAINQTTKIEYLNPVVYLTGSRYKSKWKAKLNIIDFSEACLNVLL